MARCCGLAGHSAALPGEQQVHRRHHKEREQGANRHASEDHDTHRITARRAGTRGNHQRHNTEYHRCGRHQDRTQAYRRRRFDRLALALPGLAISLYPYLLPPSVTIASAAASPKTLVFMLTGIGMLLPIMLIYNGYQYFVFRGKASQHGNE